MLRREPVRSCHPPVGDKRIVNEGGEHPQLAVLPGVEVAGLACRRDLQCPCSGGLREDVCRTPQRRSNCARGERVQ